MAEDQKDSAPESTEANGTKPGARRKKPLVVALLVLAVVLAAGVPATLVLIKGNKHAEHLPDDAAEQDQLKILGHDDELELEDGEEPIGAIVPLDTFVVNIRGGKYLRAQIQLEFIELDVPFKFYRKLVPIRDGIVQLLIKQSPEDLLTEKGRDKLKSDIKNSIDETLRKATIRNVYFTQFVIQ